MNIISFRDQDETFDPLDAGHGLTPWKMKRPKIYAAGRMSTCKQCHDWRDKIDGFGGALYETEGDKEKCGDEIDLGYFVYIGPFVVATSGGHSQGHGLYPDAHREIWDVDQCQIRHADLVVAWIEDAECFGTLCELGFAHGLNKPIALGFSTAMIDTEAYAELWLCRMLASKVYIGTPREFWAQVCRDWIAGGRS